MHRELIEYLRAHALELVKMARETSDEALASKLETMAIELLKRAAELERDSRL
jgi:hypothetical protein